MKGTQVVTIKSFSPMFKDGEEAANIHIVNVEEHGFDIVAQKSLYSIGDKVLYIQPDFCLSNISLFESFIAPESNPNKSRLGKNNRIKAVKFGFTNNKGNKVYSNGILLPLDKVFEFIKSIDNNEKILQYSNTNYYSEIDFDFALGITKYEEPEKGKVGNTKGDLPNGMYKTDETNFKNNFKQLEKLLPCQLIGSIKIDGSSNSIYFKSQTNYGICSRLLEKYLTEKSYVGYKKYYHKDSKIMGWLLKSDNTTFISDDDMKLFEENNKVEVIETIAQDDFVELGYPILEKLKQYNKPLTVRSEIFGNSLKGSGNKNNPHAKLPKSITVYGIDDYSTNVCIPLPMIEVINICKELELPMVDIIFNKVFNTIDEIENECEEYFKSNLIEGIVIRTYEINGYSGKYMNNEYDSRK